GAGLISIIGRYYIIGIAFIFAFITFLFILYWADRLGATPLGIVIVVILGIAMIWLYATLNSLILYFCGAGVVKEIGFWSSVGHLGRASWDNLLPVSIVLVGCILLLLLISLTLKLRDCDAISIRMGTENSPAMENKRVRILIIAIASILVASTICFTGMIAFMGLVAPHIAYVTVGKDNKFLLPTAGLIGALLLVGADIVARTIIAPVIIPVGVITSLIGAPLFIYLLIKIIIRLTR
ncbi:MAG TPA: iron ABC transporter permease, partial [Methanophagales archaeon]|nr:iron ABC transporter permease [Methanophagales archaeon]